MLRAILNKSWRQHPTRHQLYGHLPPIMKTIQVRRTRHAGHCWRRKDELISDVLIWTPTYGRAKAGRPARTYIQQLHEDTGCSPQDLPKAMNDREKWRERVRDICASSTMMIYIYIYIYILRRIPFSIQRLNSGFSRHDRYTADGQEIWSCLAKLPSVVTRGSADVTGFGELNTWPSDIVRTKNMNKRTRESDEKVRRMLIYFLLAHRAKRFALPYESLLNRRY